MGLTTSGLGMAASSLVRWPRPAGADACSVHQPAVAVVASTSTYPISRGGATGTAT